MTTKTQQSPAPNDWLAELKIGDMVIAVRDYIAPSPRKVVKVTPTQILVDTGAPEPQRYRRDTGALIGRGQWDTSHIEQATPGAIAEIRLKKKRNVLANYKGWDTLPADVIEQVYAAVTAAVKTQEGVGNDDRNSAH